jgi:hypothetical protein
LFGVDGRRHPAAIIWSARSIMTFRSPGTLNVSISVDLAHQDDA